MHLGLAQFGEIVRVCLHHVEERTFDLVGENFAVGGGGDYRDGDGFILTGFRPYRSNIHFSTKPDVYERFKIPTFGRYRLDVQVESVDSNEAEIIGINLGDGRYPTSIRSVHRIPMPHRSKSFTTELTLKAGDQLMLLE